jgi:hypothetical protein
VRKPLSYPANAVAKWSASKGDSRFHPPRDGAGHVAPVADALVHGAPHTLRAAESTQVDFVTFQPRFQFNRRDGLQPET